MPFIEYAQPGFPTDFIYGGRPFTATPESQNCDDGTPPLKLLILGNSITYSPIQPASQWYGTWGMAATTPAKDYTHQLTQRIANALQRPINTRTAAIWAWEADYTGFDYGRLAEYRNYKPDFFIYRAGDNIADTDPNLPNLAASIVTLINYIANGRGMQTIITGTFYQRYLVDAIAARVASERILPFTTFIDMWLNPDYHAYNLPDAGVRIHPSDLGHTEIARRIFVAGQGGKLW